MWNIMTSHGFPMGGYVFRSQERAQEVFDGLARGCDYVDGYLIEPAEVNYQSKFSITSGLGIGGHGSDDYSLATEAEQPEPQFSQRKSSGQLWEPCAKHGCHNEPSCLSCGYCLDKHCHCGG